MESAVTSLWLKVQEGATESCTLDHCQQRFPTDARDVAVVCRKLSERVRQVCVDVEVQLCVCTCTPVHLSVCLSVLQDPSIRGIFHFSGKQQMTKYEMAVAIAQTFNLPSSHLIPVNIQLHL